jgi:hypothetical protein
MNIDDNATQVNYNEGYSIKPSAQELANRR